MTDRPTEFPRQAEALDDATDQDVAAVGCGTCDRCERVDLPFSIEDAAACIRLRDDHRTALEQAPVRRAA